MDQKQKKDRRSEQRTSGLLWKILPIFFVILLLISGIKAGSIVRERKVARESYGQLQQEITLQFLSEPTNEPAKSVETEAAQPEEPEKTEGSAEPVRERKKSLDFTDLQARYPDMAAWLYSEGTGMSYPVMLAKDNSYYLTHLYNGKANANGALFIDCSNSGLFTDANTVIYGHNMNNGAMFHPLNEYKDQQFYDAWPTMTVCTPQGDWLVELICGTVEDGNYEFVRFNFDDDAAMQKYVDGLRARSTFQSDVQLQPGDRLISFCTCTYELENARYMLVGRISPIFE